MALLKQAMRDAPQPPVTVTLTRIAPRALDCDNNQAGFKACRDSVAEWLGRDDADPCISWRYAQRRGHTAQYAAEVVVEWAA